MSVRKGTKPKAKVSRGSLLEYPNLSTVMLSDSSQCEDHVSMWRNCQPGWELLKQSIHHVSDEAPVLRQTDQHLFGGIGPFLISFLNATTLPFRLMCFQTLVIVISCAARLMMSNACCSSHSSNTFCFSRTFCMELSTKARFWSES